MAASGLSELLDRPIAFHRAFVRVGGGVHGALMLSQALYWMRRASDSGGWFYKTRGDWEDETGLTRREQETARARLRAAGIWQEEQRGMRRAIWYRVDLPTLERALSDASGGMRPMEGAENARCNGRNATVVPYSETTAETTAEEEPPLSPRDRASCLYGQVSSELFAYLRTLPTRRQREELMETLEFHFERGEVLAEEVAAAIGRAKAWDGLNRGGRPSVGALLTALAQVLGGEAEAAEVASGGEQWRAWAE